MKRRGGVAELAGLMPTQPVKFNINKPDKDGRTPLYAALDPNLEYTIKGLIEEKERIGSDRINIAKLLIANGADVTKGSPQGVTAIHWSALKGDVDLLQQMLLTTTDIDKPDAEGNTPLYLAVYVDNLDATKLLIANGADVNKERPKDKSTPLHFVASVGDLAFVKEILPKVKDINKQDSEGRTALYLALENSHTDIAKLLVANGADVNIQENEFSMTPLYLAAWKGNYVFLEEILPKTIEEDDNEEKGNEDTGN